MTRRLAAALVATSMLATAHIPTLAEVGVPGFDASAGR
jgi:hypothetical protein